MRPISRTRRMSEAGRSLLRPRFAALAAALSLFAAAPAAADVLVSNIGQTSLTFSGQLENNDAALRFTTGAAADGFDGFTLESVEISFSTAPSGVSVKIATGLTTTNAGTTVATLTNPSSLAAGNLTFTAPANTSLLANTNYWVVIEGSSGRLSMTASGAEDGGGKTGWSIRDEGELRSAQSTGGWNTFTNVWKIRVNGANRDVTAPSFSSATVNGTQLQIKFDENLAQRAFLSNLANSAFTVRKTPDGGTEADASLTGSPTKGAASNTLNLRLATGAVWNDTFTVAYTKPTTGTLNKIRDAAGNETDSFGAQSVTNITRRPSPSGCGTASGTLSPSVDSTSTSITFKPNSSSQIFGGIIVLCGPFGTGGAFATANILEPTRISAGDSFTITHSGAGNTGNALTAGTDYWVRLDGYAATSPWVYIRTKGSAFPVSLALNSAGDDNTYHNGDIIEVTATFAETVTVTGSPRIPITVGANTRHAAYHSGSGGTELKFRYTVVTADVDTDGIAIAQSALELNGGAINAGGTAAELGHAAVAANAAHKADGGAASVSTVEFTSKPANNYLTIGNDIEVTVTFDRPVTVTGAPRLELSPAFGYNAATEANDVVRHATYSSGSGGTALVFKYTLVDEDDSGSTNVTVAANALALNGGTIRTGTANAALAHTAEDSGKTVSVKGPRIVLVGLGSPPTPPTVDTDLDGTTETYAEDDDITVAVSFDRDIVITGQPANIKVVLTIGETDYTLAGGRALASKHITFNSHQVTATDADTDGITLKRDSSGNVVRLSGAATIKGALGGNAAVLTLDADPKVTRELPDEDETVLTSLNVRGANAAPTASDFTVATPEDTTYTFAASVFAFSDANSDLLKEIQIVSLPAASGGALKLSGTAIASTDLPKTVANAAIKNLTFDPTSGFEGNAAFTFKAVDTFGAVSAAAATATVQVGASAPCAASTSDFWDESSNISVSSTSDSISVTATTQAGSSRFDLCKTGSSSIHATATVSGINPMHTFTGLDASTQYWARVHNASEGTSQWIAISTGAAPADTAPDFGTATVANQSYTQNAAITDLVLPAATGGNGALTYAITPALPAGLTFTASTRTVSGTPTATQAATTYTYKVTDADGNTADSDADTLTFTIAVAAADTAPDFGTATVPNQSYTQNSAITDLVLPSATGGNGALTYAITPALPAGLTFTASTRTVSGTPTGTQAATTYTYKVTDADGNTNDSDTDTLTFTIAVAAEPPAKVTGVSVTAGVGALAVSWTTVTGATGYKVQWKSGSQSYDATNRQATVTGTSHTIPSLTAGTQYTVRVIATKTNADDGTPSVEKTGTPKAAAPGQVTGVTVTPGVGTLDVSWTAVTGATGYKVQWKSGSQNYDSSRQATVGEVTSHTIPSLTAGTPYTVRVIATKTNANDGPASDDATGTPRAAAPGQVTGVSVTAGVGTLEVSWTAVSGATGYKVQWKSGSQNYDETNRQATLGEVTSHTIPSLTAGTQYTVRVIATKNNADDGLASAEVTGIPKAAAPAKVTGVSVSAGVGTLDVSWTAVTGATGYKVEWKSGSENYDSSRQATVGEVTSHTIPSLTAGTQYTVRVIATKTNADDGPASDDVAGTPQAAAPGQVTGVSVTAGVGTLAVSWDAVSGATGYKVQWKSGSQNYDETNRQATVTGTSHTISSLTAGTEFTVRVIATLSNASDGDPSAEVTGTPKTTAPGQVTGVTVTPGVGTLDVSWTAVTGATGYKVQWKSGSQNYDETNRQRVVSSGTTVTDTIPSLTAGTQYTVRVIATKTNADDGTPSTEAMGTPRAAAPAQVTGVMATPAVEALQVTWASVTGATGYKVQWKSGSQDYDETNRQATVGAVTSHRIPDLTAGTQYTVQVIATKTNADDGPASAEVTGIPEAAAPGQVTGVTVTPGVRTLAVSWTTVTGATGYKVQWKSGSQDYDETNRQETATGTSHTISGLTAGTQYTVRVIATLSNASDGPPSDGVTGTPTAVTAPPPPPPPGGGGGGGGGGSPPPGTPPPLTPDTEIDVGENTFQAGDHEVTVRREAGTPAVRLALPASVAGDIVVTVSAVAPDVPLESGAFGLGPAGARTVVDVDVDNVPAGGLTLCLPASAALREASAGELLLLHWRDGRWTEVPGAALNPAGTHVCATVTSFSPFAVGYRTDVAPRFDRPAPSLVLADGEAMDPVVLPQATDGNGDISYSLTSAPAGLAGLTFNAATRRLSGTPDAAGDYEFTYTAHDADANRADTDAAVLTFAVTVEDPRVAAVKRSVRRTLSAVARRSLTSALDNIGARFAASVPASGLTLAGHAVPLGTAAGTGLADTGAEQFCSPDSSGLPGTTDGFGTDREHCAFVTRGMTSEELLHASAFSLTLGAAGGSGNTGTGTPPSPQWAVWGRGDLGTFAGRPEPGTGYEGELQTGWLGVDARAGAWVMGLALSHGTGEADYDFAEGGVSGEGRLETSLTALYPYGRWTLSEGLEVRGVLGAGSGEARHWLDGETDETGERSDLAMWMGSLGLRREFPSLGEIDLALRADASLARMETGDGTEHIANLTADSWRLRAGVEASRRFALDGDAALEPFVEAAARRDGGDGLEGTGLEIAGGVRYTAPRLQIEMRGRWLASHSEEGAEESGVSVTARMGPGARGRGLSLSLSPRWGADTGGAEALWRDELPGPAGSDGTASMDARIGYGFSWTPYGLNGLMTPFAETSISGEDSRRVRLGARFDASRLNLRVELAGERLEGAASEPEHALRLDIGLRF